MIYLFFNHNKNFPAIDKPNFSILQNVAEVIIIVLYFREIKNYYEETNFDDHKINSFSIYTVEKARSQNI